MADIVHNEGINPPLQNQQPQQQQQQQRQQGGSLGSIMQFLFRIFMMYYFFKMFNSPATNDSATSHFNATSFMNISERGNVTSSSFNSTLPPNLLPLFPLNTAMDLYMFITEDETLPESHFKQLDDNSNTKDLGLYSFVRKNLTYGDWSFDVTEQVSLPVSKALANNGSIYAHIYLAANDVPIDPSLSKPAREYRKEFVAYKKRRLNWFMPKKKEVIKKKLVGGEDTDDYTNTNANNVESNTPTTHPNLKDQSEPILSYWYPNFTLALVTDTSPLPRHLPINIMQHVEVTEDQLFYQPILFVNDFWVLSEHLTPINDTVKDLNLTVMIHPMSLFKFQLYSQMEESFRLQTTMLGSSKTEIESFKQMLLDTNPYFLGLTMVVSLLHSFFEFLAFKNDIQFWKDKKDTEGLSFRAILLNVFFQGVIFLYLLDNDTSWMIIVSSFVGLLIEIWKIRKVVQVKLSRPNNSFLPKLEFISLAPKTKRQTKTQKYDAEAFQYLSYALYPLLFCYTIYALVYEEHKSWYSFIVGTLVGFVYTFGFIAMTPQIYINYKLKSVSGLSFRTFTYKFLNTIIDDLFSFIIKMPTLHRLACFRDDIIFLIYLYQRWIYRVDPRRRNEYGQKGDVDAESESEEDVDEDVDKKVDVDVKEKEKETLLEDSKDEKDGLRARDKKESTESKSPTKSAEPAKEAKKDK